MITTLSNQDPELDIINASYQDIIDSITLNDVKDFLESLGVNQIVVNEEKQYLICPTICHNPIESAESMKLYWYQNNKIFRCYTECNEAMSIFELYKRYMGLNHYPITIEEAREHVKKHLKHLINNAPARKRSSVSYDQEVDKYQYKVNIPELEEYPNFLLDCFSHYYHPLWLKDGITKEAMDQFNIRFSIE